MSLNDNALISPRSLLFLRALSNSIITRPMRTKTGIVTSTKMQKTIVVSVETSKTHPKYKKRYVSTSKFYAHDENGLAKL